MGECCDPRGYNDVFGARFARRLASRYRKRGPDKTATLMASYLADRGVDDASVLEIGGGVGDLQLALLRHGAARTTNLELSDAYDEEAHALARAEGVGDRITRRRLDIAATPDAVAVHDVVVLHRVVCCYPDYERLLTAAADHASRMLVFSHPPRNRVVRMLTALENTWLRLTRKSFRTFAHPPEAMVAVAEARGLRTDYTHHGMAWHVVGLVRSDSASDRMAS